jgi:hypothetical protein
MSATLDKIIEEVRSLLPEEQRQLIEQLNAILPATEVRAVSEDEVERLLAKQGIINLPAEMPSVTARPKPIHVSGKPVSETIIEERR